MHLVSIKITIIAQTISANLLVAAIIDLLWPLYVSYSHDSIILTDLLFPLINTFTQTIVSIHILVYISIHMCQYNIPRKSIFIFFIDFEVETTGKY